METSIKLKKHQLIPIEFMKKNRALLLYHGTGTGKTFTALFAMYQFKNEIVIIGPKNSKKTFVDHMEKAKMDRSRFTFYSFQKIKKLLEEDVTLLKQKSVIIDEAHNLRTENLHNLYIASSLSLAHKFILLTATPVINGLHDLSVLINMVKNDNTLPTERELFKQMFYDEDSRKIINEQVLLSKLRNCISYYYQTDKENYPDYTEHYEEVEMSPIQLTEYVNYVKKIIYEDKITVKESDLLNIDYAALATKKKNIFLNVTRQLSNTMNHDPNSPKIQEIFQRIKKGPKPAIVYSNFLKNGIYTLAMLLETSKLSYGVITGKTTADKIEQVVNDYNDKKYDVMLISSAGSESLNFKRTRQIHIMEPHWNEAKISQVIGRAVRYQSHIDLPVKQRHVEIYRWISIFPKHIKNLSADQHLAELSEYKVNLYNHFHKLIVEASIEKNK